MEDWIADAETMLAAMVAERRRAGRLIVAVTALLALSAGTLMLANMVHQRVAEDGTALLAALDEQGRKAAKARHPAGRDRRSSSGNRPAAQPATQQEAGPLGRAAEEALGQQPEA